MPNNHLSFCTLDEEKFFADHYLSMMCAPFSCLDGIFARWELSPTEFEPKKRTEDTKEANERWYTYRRIGHYRPRHVYRRGDGIKLAFWRWLAFLRLSIVRENRTGVDRELYMDQEIRMNRADADTRRDRDNRDSRSDVWEHFCPVRESLRLMSVLRPTETCWRSTSGFDRIDDVCYWSFRNVFFCWFSSVDRLKHSHDREIRRYVSLTSRPAFLTELRILLIVQLFIQREKFIDQFIGLSITQIIGRNQIHR